MTFRGRENANCGKSRENRMELNERKSMQEDLEQSLFISYCFCRGRIWPFPCMYAGSHHGRRVGEKENIGTILPMSMNVEVVYQKGK